MTPMSGAKKMKGILFRAIDESGDILSELPASLRVLSVVTDSFCSHWAVPDGMEVIHALDWDAVRLYTRKLASNDRSLLILCSEAPAMQEIFDVWDLGLGYVAVWLESFGRLSVKDLVKFFLNGCSVQDSRWFVSEAEVSTATIKSSDCEWTPTEMFEGFCWDRVSADVRAHMGKNHSLFGSQWNGIRRSHSKTEWVGFICAFRGRLFVALALFVSEKMEPSCVRLLLSSLPYRECLDQCPPELLLSVALLHGYGEEWGRAIECVGRAYERDVGLQDGYAKLGWQKIRFRDYRNALRIMKKDEEINRMSPRWRVQLAQVYGRIGQYDLAEILIEKAYCEDSKIKDGFVRLGWQKAEDEDWFGALAIMRKDEIAGRITEKKKEQLSFVSQSACVSKKNATDH